MTWDTVTKYRHLLEINNAIVKETTRTGLFQALSVEISRIFQYDRFSITLYDPPGQILELFRLGRDGISPAGISEEQRPLGKGAIAKAVIRSRRPLIIPDLSTSTPSGNRSGPCAAAGLSATMAYPLIVRNRVLGAIHFSFVQTPDNLAELVDFLTELSGQVAIAVDNMLAHTELKSINENLQRQKDFLLSQVDEGNAQESARFFYSKPGHERSHASGENGGPGRRLRPDHRRNRNGQGPISPGASTA